MYINRDISVKLQNIIEESQNLLDEIKDIERPKILPLSTSVSIWQPDAKFYVRLISQSWNVVKLVVCDKEGHREDRGSILKVDLETGLVTLCGHISPHFGIPLNELESLNVTTDKYVI